MENLPVYVTVVFLITTALTVLLLFKGTHYSGKVIIISLAWIILQSAIGLSGFYSVTNVIPPRFPFLLFPPVILLIILFSTGKGRAAADRFDPKTLTLLHIVRIPVELTLYWLFLNKSVPELITFEGRNFDIFCGLTAPIIYYLGYVKSVLNKNALIAWNVLCLALLANVVITAVLSVPLPIQQFAFDQPNIAMLYFPFMLLPCFIVPAVLFSHLVSLKQLTRKY